MASLSILKLVRNEMCTGCGLCVSESDGSLEMGWNDDGFLIPQPRSGNETPPASAIRVCPFNPEPDLKVRDEDKLAELFLEDAPRRDRKSGRYHNAYIGYSPQYRPSSSSGGLATYIFEKLLETGIVEALYIVREINGSYEYAWFHRGEDITRISKTRYYPVTLAGLFQEIDSFDGKVAVSGVACFIKAIRLKQHYHPELKEKIPFLIGIICGGWKSRFFTEYLAQSAGITTSYKNQEYRIKDPASLSSDYSFGATDQNGVFHQMKMSKVGDMWGSGLFKSKACDFCTDVLTELADISLGDAWLDEYRKDGMGNSVIVTRSRAAESLIRAGMEDGTLHVTEVPIDRIIASQRSSFDHRQNAISYRVQKERKREPETVPQVRKRCMRQISLPYQWVQWQRMRTRRKSLEFWKQFPFLPDFNRLMEPEFKRLRRLNRIRATLKKIKSKIAGYF